MTDSRAVLDPLVNDHRDPRPPLRSRATTEYLRSHVGSTPVVVVDLEVVGELYRRLTGAVPAARCHYAVKANPHPAVLDRLCRLGSAFDVASIGEVRACLAAGARPEQLSYGNTVKKEADIAEAHRLGVTRFAFDSAFELDKLHRAAPGATVFCRLASDGRGAAWPLSGKFGCSECEARRLLRDAAGAGHPVGLSFHVGSQQSDPFAWDRALEGVARVRGLLALDGVTVRLIDIGGGFPGTYAPATPSLEVFGTAVSAAIERHLGPDRPEEILMEPGRALVADAGTIRTEVVAVSPDRIDGSRWVYLDVGMFSGLVEVMDEAIRYRISPADPDERRPTAPAVVAGPTCDSADVLYRSGCDLPVDLQPGELLDIQCAGAYTISYASVGFNGFDPPEVVVLSGERR